MITLLVVGSLGASFACFISMMVAILLAVRLSERLDKAERTNHLLRDLIAVGGDLGAPDPSEATEIPTWVNQTIEWR